MSQHTINIQSVAEFDALVAQNERPVVIDFWAPWCGPCQALGPVLEAAAETAGDSAIVAKVNIDELRDLAQAQQVTSIPTLLFYNGGQQTARQSGQLSKDAILQELQLPAEA